MSLKRKGNTGWKRQVGSGEGEKDSALIERTEEWNGPRTSYAAWIQSYPVGSACPDNPLLKLTPPSWQELPAGMRRATLTWVGGQADGNGIIFGQGLDRPRPDEGGREPKSQTVAGIVGYKFEVTDETVPPGRTYTLGNPEANTGPTGQQGTRVFGYSPVQFTVSFYSPTLTYKYGSTSFISADRFRTLANTELAGEIEIFSKQMSESPQATLKSVASGKRYVLKLKAGLSTGDGSPTTHVAYVLPGDTRSLEKRYFSSQWDTVGQTDVVPVFNFSSVGTANTVLRCQGPKCRYRAPGMFEVIETWAKELTTNEV